MQRSANLSLLTHDLELRRPACPAHSNPHAGGDNIFVTIPGKNTATSRPGSITFTGTVAADHMPGLHWWVLARHCILICIRRAHPVAIGRSASCCCGAPNPRSPVHPQVPPPVCRYHPHVHGSSTIQVFTAAGLIIVEGERGSLLACLPACELVTWLGVYSPGPACARRGVAAAVWLPSLEAKHQGSTCSPSAPAPLHPRRRPRLAARRQRLRCCAQPAGQRP